ncbi:unnamed protein product [Caenorhabditis sp. 36 PRJEB53466]|nr:unnamed protein product [Caenorhabditis sp. 36 PRJEB53466]
MYKSNGRDQNELRRKRREDEVQIRKVKLEEKFDRNRKITVERPMMSDEQTSELVRTTVEKLQSMQAKEVNSAILEVYENVSNGTWTLPLLIKVEILNKLADVYCNRPINGEARDVVSRILLKLSGHETTDREKSDEKCMQALSQNLSSYNDNEEILCDTLQAFACFFARSVAFRNLALDFTFIPDLLALYDRKLSLHMNRSLMWITAVFCERLYNYSPDVTEILPLLDMIADGIQSSDSMIRNDATATLVALSDWRPILEHISCYRLCSMLVQNLRNSSGNARPTVKWGISSIIQTTSHFTEEMIDAGLLTVLRSFINVSYMSQEVCFIISNICVEGVHNIDKLIESGVLREVARVMETSEYRVRKEAAYVMCHCCLSTKPAHLQYMLENGMLAPLTDLLTCMDASLVSFILDALQALLDFGLLYFNSVPASNPVVVKLEEIGCREKLNFLCESQCVDIHAKAYTMLESYFENEDETPAIDMNLAHQSIDDTIDTILNYVNQNTSPPVPVPSSESS